MSKEPYQVSILVPVYGVEKYIERCARSIFEQTYHNLDIIFVDDCTPDHSIDILKHVLEDYPDRKEQTRIIKHDHNRGLAAARNTGVAEAKGEFVVHVDSDDWIEPDALERLVSKQRESGADIVTGLFCLNNNTMDKNFLEPEYSDKNEMLENILSQWLHHELWGRLINRSLYSHTDVYSLEGVNVGEDWRIVPMLLWYANGFARLNRTVYHYVMSDDSYMRKEKSWPNMLRMMVERYTNYSSLIGFFKNKEKKYYDLTKQKSAHACYCVAYEALRHDDKKTFYEYRRTFLSEYSPEMKQCLSNIVNVLIRMPYSYSLLKAYWEFSDFIHGEKNVVGR